MGTEIAANISAFALYAGLSGILLVLMIARMIWWRGKSHIYEGDGENRQMQRMMRGQSNFIETVPLALIMLVTIALMGAPLQLIHGLGAALVIGRVLHAIHFFFEGTSIYFRMFGMLATIAVLVIEAIGLVLHAVS